MKKVLNKIRNFYRKYKKIINTALRIIISTGLITYLVISQFKDFKTISGTLKDLNILFLLLSFSTHIYGIWITAYRWQTLLKTQNVNLSILSLTSSTLIGQFFNNFLPTSIGGDVYRAYDVVKKSDFPMSSSISVIVVERLSGIIASAVFAAAALFLGFTAIGGKSIIIPIVIFLAVSIIIFFLILNPNIFGLNKVAKKIKFLEKILSRLRNVYNTFLTFKKYKWTLVKVIFYSLTLQFAVIINYWLASKALGIPLDLTAFIFIVPVVSIIAMLPISLGGIGVREGSLVFLMVSLGAQNAKAAMCSLLLFAMLLIIGIAGGLIYAIRPFLAKKEKERLI
ncbi:MAG: flippase-like domain-containing protein [Actinobacteria bacterium]|nr:flippase-like domain-containing protein [Cyanobacteriota bacterium]MCL5771791.1 flippase-like domain-containing protein [Actinomycetota bacterium]